MNRLIRPTRLIALVLFTAALLSIYAVSLYKLQIVEGQAYYEQSQNNIVTTRTVKATRGNILDRYGRTLVSNRSCSNLIIDTDELFNEETVEDPNAVILELVRLVRSCGDDYADELPISQQSPFQYDSPMSDEDRTRLDLFLEDKGWDLDLSAVELMASFRTRYEIDNSYTSEEMRIIAGVRYALNMHTVVQTTDYIFVEDASMELITTVLESGIPGVEIQNGYVREYQTQYAAHVLGYISTMSGTEWELYQDQGYSYDALVGKDGAEYAFESWLHGTDGEARITSTASGTVTDMVYTKEPVPGNNVYLTIDIGLQEAAEQALSSGITQLNTQREEDNAAAVAAGTPEDVMELSTGGAIVVVDVKTSEPLCIASYPTFSADTVLEDFSELLADENAPLFNRALMGTYAPGSTFKPVTAIAALNEGKVTVDYTIYDEGIFTKYSDVDTSYMPTCWIYGQGSHGDVNVTTAIEHSCNYYFYTVGDLVGIDSIAHYAQLFGLGEPTGIELAEDVGHMATPAYKAEIYSEDSTESEWFVGDTLAAAIGQSVSQFTPLQLANYTAAIANDGLRHEASILKTVRSFDGTEKLFERTAVVSGDVDVDESYYDAVQEGMYLVATSGNSPTVYAAFQTADYTLAAKTGTAQRGENLANNACFICYAPYEDPEIAMAVVIEKGGAGANLASIAREVLDYYFAFTASTKTLETEQTLLK